MTDSTFRVVFSGRTLPGQDRDTAISNFARMIKRTPDQVAGAFGGKASVLKKGISEIEAEKYCRALENAGLMVHAEAEATTAGLSLAADDDVAPAKPAMTLSLAAQDDAPMAVAGKNPQPAAPAVEPPKISSTLALVEDDEHRKEEAVSNKPQAEMTCPACGHKQPKAEICDSCHVVIEKFLQRRKEKAKEAAERAARTAANAPDEPYADGEPKPSLLGKLFGKLKKE